MTSPKTYEELKDACHASIEREKAGPIAWGTTYIKWFQERLKMIHEFGFRNVEDVKKHIPDSVQDIISP